MSRRREVWLLSLRRRIKSLLRWLIPGLGVKRWYFFILTGITLLGLGLAIFLVGIYTTAPKTWWLPALTYISLQFLARPVRVAIFGLLGLGLLILGIWGLNR